MKKWIIRYLNRRISYYIKFQRWAKENEVPYGESSRQLCKLYMWRYWLTGKWYK